MSSDRRKSRSQKKRLMAGRTFAPCHWCHSVLDAADLTIDHVIAISCGGPDVIENVVLACSLCNGRRGKAQNSLNRAKPLKVNFKRDELYRAISHVQIAKRAFIHCAGCDKQLDLAGPNTGKMYSFQIVCRDCLQKWSDEAYEIYKEKQRESLNH